MDVPDARLIELTRNGSAAAAAELFDRYWPQAWKAAYAVINDRAVADDVAQDAVQRAFAALNRFDESRAFGPWLKRIAVNCAIDELRRRGRVDSLDEQRSLHLSGSESRPVDPRASRTARSRDAAVQPLRHVPGALHRPGAGTHDARLRPAADRRPCFSAGVSETFTS